MFILTGTTKERIVTSGVLIAFLLLAWVSIIGVRHGGYNLIIPFLSLLIVVTIIRGISIGYWLARFILGIIAIAGIVGTINPFAYDDCLAAHASFSEFVISGVMTSAVAVFLFYCLGEHAKLRGVRLLFRYAAKRTAAKSPPIIQQP
jgi:hypothetical protein